MNRTTRRSTSERFRANLQKAIDYKKSMGRYVIADLAAKSGVSERMIHSVLAGESRLTVDVAEALGAALGFNAWLMLLEGFDPSIKQAEMFERYLTATDHDRAVIDTVLNHPKKKTGG